MNNLDQEKIEELRETFDHFDSDNNGKIDFQEFKKLLDALDSGMNHQEMEVGFDVIDNDNNGYIDFEEFIEWWGER